MTVEEFYAEVRAAIKRGASQDANIPNWVRRACSFIEKNHIYDYMRVTARFTWDGAAEIALPTGFRKFAFVRYVVEGDDGTEQYYEILGTDEGDIVTTQAEFQFYFRRAAKLWFDALPEEDTIVEWSYYAYTDWAGLELSDSPAVLTHAYDGLFGQTLWLASIDLKDARMMEPYRKLRDEGLNVEIRSDLESTQSSSESMQYQGLYGR